MNERPSTGAIGTFNIYLPTCRLRFDQAKASQPPRKYRNKATKQCCYVVQNCKTYPSAASELFEQQGFNMKESIRRETCNGWKEVQPLQECWGIRRIPKQQQQKMKPNNNLSYSDSLTRMPSTICLNKGFTESSVKEGVVSIQLNISPPSTYGVIK